MPLTYKIHQKPLHLGVEVSCVAQVNFPHASVWLLLKLTADSQARLST